MPKSTKKTTPSKPRVTTKRKETKPVVSTPVTFTPDTLRGILIGSAVLVLIILLISLGSFKKATVKSYEECLVAKGSQLLLMYPGVCVTKDGKRFTEAVTPSPTPISYKDDEDNHGVWSCPPTEYINCMPTLPEEDFPCIDCIDVCSENYLNWARNNCPGFKGAAY